SLRVARENARRNCLGHMIRYQLANGWRNGTVHRSGPYDLVFTNIFARQLCAMAKSLSAHLAPGGTAILSGLLATQARSVTRAHRPPCLRRDTRFYEGPWVTLVLRKSATEPSMRCSRVREREPMRMRDRKLALCRFERGQCPPTRGRSS